MATFTYFGEEFSYAEQFPDFAYAEFCEAMEEEEVSPTRATGIALRLAKACVAKPDLGRFVKVSRENNAKTEDWLKVFQQWTAEAAERPTGQPTDSSGGPDSIPQTSGSEPAASVTTIGAERPVRGDLALALSRSA